MSKEIKKLITLWAIIFFILFVGIGISLAEQGLRPPPPGASGIINQKTIPRVIKGANTQKNVANPITRNEPNKIQNKEREEIAPDEKATVEIEKRGEIIPGELTGEEFNSGIDFVPPRPNEKITLNINDVDLPELVRFISLQTGKRFILGGKVRSIKATIFAPTKVTVGEAYQSFLAVLQANGLTVVPVGGGRYLEIIQSTDASKTNIPTYFPGEKGLFGERVITRLHHVDNVSAEQISQLLTKFKSEAGDIVTYVPTNTLIITDYATNINRMLKITNFLDIPGSTQQIWIEPVNNASATELADLIMEIFDARGSGSKSSNAPRKITSTEKVKNEGGSVGVSTGDQSLRIIADERTNSLIIMTSERTYMIIIELLRRLDVQIAGEGEIHVHPLQNSDSEELADVLSSIIGGGRSSSKSATKKRGESGSAEGSVLEGAVKITADKATNSLIIVSNARDYAQLRKMINELDQPRRQVFVEAVIMEVSLDTTRRLGLAFHAGSSIGTSEGDAVLLGGTQLGGLQSVILDPTTLMGMAVGLQGPDIPGTEGLIQAGESVPSFGVMLQALQTNNDVNILSTPHILATNNEEAEISVGGNVPIQQGFMTSLGSSSKSSTTVLGGNLPVSVGRQNVGLSLKITPHINDSNQVRLELEVEISEVTGESNLGPIISERKAKSTNIVQDQLTVVLGGLITDNVTETTNKIPVLGDIPILGYFFKHSVKTITKRNLLIFLTPYIIRNSNDFRDLFRRKLEERREFIERFTAFQAKRLEPYIDYNKTNGVVQMINQSIDYLDEQALIEEQLKQETEIKHMPREPVKLPPNMGETNSDLSEEVVIEETTRPNNTIRLASDTTDSGEENQEQTESSDEE